MKKGVDIDYKEKNGLLYPDLHISNDPMADTTPLGKYGQMCLNYLKEEHPDRYDALLMEGELMPLMHRVNEEAYQQIESITDKLIKKQGYSDSSDTMVMFRRRNAYKEVAEEVIIREFVLIPR